MLEKEQTLFNGLMIRISLELGASLEDEGADVFKEKIYNEYCEAGKPDNQEEWLKNRLKDCFKYVTEPPIWIEEEPTWPFLNNEPMVFISQTELKKNKVTEEFLTWDEVVYLFGARQPFKKGFEMVYTTTVQLKGM